MLSDAELVRPGKGGSRPVDWMTEASIFEESVLSHFSLIFFFGYADPQGDFKYNARREHTLMMYHTVPFFGLQLGALSVAVSSGSVF